MRINDVLEALNKSIDIEREHKEIKVLGHFTSYTNIEKAIGPYKRISIHINYINKSRKAIPFVGVCLTERCLTDKEDKAIAKAEIEVLIRLFSKYKEEYKEIVEGTYGTE